jgi:hypothetical protein
MYEKDVLLMADSTTGTIDSLKAENEYLKKQQ